MFDRLTYVRPAFRWEVKQRVGRVPNVADISNPTSVRIAIGMFEALGVPSAQTVSKAGDPGPALEAGIEQLLADALGEIDPLRNWTVARGKLIAAYHQYEHLERLAQLIKQDPTYRAEIARDYSIKPDVVVGELREAMGNTRHLLHAVVSCKWTIRSDRVQNIRHEAVLMIRHRRGRLPHIVAVTAEPLPSRIASIARGTGEIDAVYHVALGALSESVSAGPWHDQQDTLDELVGQRRLFDLAELAGTLAG